MSLSPETVHWRNNKTSLNITVWSFFHYNLEFSLIRTIPREVTWCTVTCNLPERRDVLCFALFLNLRFKLMLWLTPDQTLKCYLFNHFLLIRFRVA